MQLASLQNKLAKMNIVTEESENSDRVYFTLNGVNFSADYVGAKVTGYVARMRCSVTGEVEKKFFDTFASVQKFAAECVAEEPAQVEQDCTECNTQQAAQVEQSSAEFTQQDLQQIAIAVVMQELAEAAIKAGKTPEQMMQYAKSEQGLKTLTQRAAKYIKA